MYIKTISIKNFRGIKDLELSFDKRFNVLIGENNSGKSTILDAIRVFLNYGRQQSDFYIRKTDFRFSSPETPEPIEFHFEFEKEQDEDLARFHSLSGLSDTGQPILKAHFKYTLIKKGGAFRVTQKAWGGDQEGNPISNEELNEHVFSVYLDALRDATSQLRPGRGNRIGDLFLKLESNSEKQIELANQVKSALDGSKEWTALLSKGDSAITEHLKGSSLLGDQLDIELDFLPSEYKKIVDSLVLGMKAQLGDGSPTISEISQNGLGLNNLLYSSVVLSDIKTFKEQEDASLAVLLIEEPEAHLHPQQQNLFFKYLFDLTEKTKFQIFITSHSPTITSKTSIDAIRSIKKVGDLVSSFEPSKVLTPENVVFLKKFLDTTKAQLFFSNGTILVEGISEAILMPVFAEMSGFDLSQLGIEVVNIGGIAFEHFAKLYNSEDENLRMNSKCCVVTDDDTGIEDGEVESRAKNALALKGGNLDVFLAKQTFEVELFLAGTNCDLLIKLWKELHPKSVVAKDDNREVWAKNFLNKVSANKAKSELSYALFTKLKNKDVEYKSFQVPTYLVNALKWVCGGPS